jgi:crotonyl-CoA carboxylase/reductase
MVVICAGTTGYNATVDLRYLWMRQKRLQGSHFANDEQSQGMNNLVLEGRVDPCLSRAFPFAEIPLAHQLMYENKHPHGNMAVLVGSPELGLGISDRAGGHKPVVVPTRSMPPPPAVPPASGPAVPYSDDGSSGGAVLDTTPVGAIMQRHVITCPRDATVEQIVQLLGEHGVHAVVVVDHESSPVGVVSRTDLVLARQGRTPEAARAMRAAQVMTVGVVTCTPDTALDAAVTLMTKSHLHRLVVIDPGSNGATRSAKMAGIVSMSDVIAATLGLREG